ncbi:hypothetical protein HMPREF3190_01741 [Umbribacter vaginalis]|nr:hypothetical protein HMPREF3190_01741 [Coriobacteriales bacterium DNF00809]
MFKRNAAWRAHVSVLKRNEVHGRYAAEQKQLLLEQEQYLFVCSIACA